MKLSVNFMWHWVVFERRVKRWFRNKFGIKRKNTDRFKNDDQFYVK